MSDVFWSNGLATLYQADAREIPLPDKSVHMCVTSPPYWGLRSYGLGQWVGGDPNCAHHKRRNDSVARVDGGILANNNHAQEGWPGGVCGHCGATQQDTGIGLEPTLGEWVANIVAVMREVKRVLRDDGTLWLNLGDAYAGSGKGMNADGTHSDGRNQTTNTDSLNPGKRTPRGPGSGRWGLGDMPVNGLPTKSLMGQPWRVAFALQDDGWILRKDIIWAKPNPMPESVTDRPTTAHEYVFLFSKQGQYFYDAESIREPHKDTSLKRYAYGLKSNAPTDGFNRAGDKSGLMNADRMGDYVQASGRNARSVWSIPTQGYSGAHFATFPEELPKRCILAGSSEHGVCAECGAPWRRVVEKRPAADYDYAGGDKQAGHGPTHAGFNARWDANNGSRTGGSLGWRPTCECNADRCPYHQAYDAYIAAYDEWELEKDGFDYGWHDRPHPGPTPEPPVGDCSCDNTECVPATVLDPFAGSGTTLSVAQQLGRRSIGLDLNPEYLKLAAERIGKIPMPLAASVESNHDLPDVPQHPTLFSL